MLWEWQKRLARRVFAPTYSVCEHCRCRSARFPFCAFALTLDCINPNQATARTSALALLQRFLPPPSNAGRALPPRRLTGRPKGCSQRPQLRRPYGPSRCPAKSPTRCCCTYRTKKGAQSSPFESTDFERERAFQTDGANDER